MISLSTVWNHKAAPDLAGVFAAGRKIGFELFELGVSSARDLAEIAACVGLAQNLSALRALASEGIQQGHMALHARQLALAAGASGEQAVRIAEQMVSEGDIRPARARELVE